MQVGIIHGGPEQNEKMEKGEPTLSYGFTPTIKLRHPSYAPGHWLSWCWGFFYIFKKDFIYLLLERGEGREKERERNASTLLDDQIYDDACALTRDGTGDLSLCRTVPNRLSHAGQGSFPGSWAFRLRWGLNSIASSSPALLSH